MKENKSTKYGICRYGNHKFEVHNLQAETMDDVLMAIFDTYEDALDAIEQLEKLERKVIKC